AHTPPAIPYEPHSSPVPQESASPSPALSVRLTSWLFIVYSEPAAVLLFRGDRRAGRRSCERSLGPGCSILWTARPHPACPSETSSTAHNRCLCFRPCNDPPASRHSG